MKKYFVFLLLFGLIAAFIAVPRNISAKGPIPPAPKPQVEIWEWYAEGVTGEETPITTAPRDWYQLKSDGLKVDGATRICHGFDDGRYGWTGEIFRLVEGTWVKLATTVGWVPNEEGHYMACAQAPAPGTYALFGYFDKSKAPVVECKYDTSGWSLGTDVDAGGDYFYASVGNLPEDTFVSYVLIGMSPAGSITGAMSGSATVGNRYDGDADFMGYNVVIEDPAESVTLRISAAGCVRVITWDFGTTD